jgi:extracellular elastinolytic metalloproteinase
MSPIEILQKMNVRILLLTASFLGFFLNLQAQNPKLQENALSFVRQFHHQWGLEEEDVSNILVRDQYLSRHNQVHHFYLQQQYRGIPIQNAITGIHMLADGKVIHQSIGFQTKITQKINTDRPTLSAQAALGKALSTLQTPPAKSGLLIQQTEPNTYLFGKGVISQLDIPVQLNFFPFQDQLRLAWEVQIYPVGQSDYWSIQIDAQSGMLLDKTNRTLNCTFEHGNYERHATQCFDQTKRTKSPPLGPSPKNQSTASYQVFPFPTESPIHGERRLLVDPADPLASPYGWHDTNAVVGPEFFTTKGNNAYAYFDTLANNLPDGDEIFKEDLNFDFPYDPLKEPASNKQAALTQLFYATNFIHDFAYYYGFDEPAGNFQNNNYRQGGLDGDEILAEAMDGSGKNNANFLPLPDGSKGRMQMYLWDLKASQLLNIESPSSIRGTYRAGTATFGPSIDTLNIRGRIVQVRDDSDTPSLGCETILNKEEIAGNIALVYRGKCRLWEKVINAQKAGAQAVIIGNNRNSIFDISGNPSEPVHIPSILVSGATAEGIINAGDNIFAGFQQPEAYPQYLDASFDNGVIAHEYAHGISSRLTGGPSTTGCLRNDEQMGEGWSDFFGLVVTTSHPENRTKGVGNYPNGSQAFDSGIRRRPYSPLDQFNDFTYQDIINTTGPHPLGEVWASMLWDLYWAFSDQYGWDSDLLNGQGGNNMAIQLVMDGMKLQACEPGFIDGRDAILKADSINYKGTNQCLIWKVFAKRGLGWSAEQGSSDDRKDGREAFDLRPSCIQALKIYKEAINTSIEAGDPIRYKIEVRNDKTSPVSELIIHDQLPEGATLIPFTVKGAEFAGQNGRQIVFRVSRIESGKNAQIQYLVQTSSEIGSNRIYFDDFQNSGSDQSWNVRARSGGRTWRLVTDTLNDLKTSWFVPNSLRTNAHFLELQKDISVNGRLPVLRFHHDFVTEPISDAGLLEVSTDEGQSWTPVSADQFLRNGYSGEIDFSTFLLHDQEGFWGDQPDIQESIIDLSGYLGQKIRIRFQFQSDSEPTTRPYDKGIGWTIHDIEFMDLQYYNTEVCVNSEQGDFACTVAEELGTTVGSIQDLTSTENPGFQEKIKVRLYPNPVRDFLNIQIEAMEVLNELNLQILSSDGRLLQSRQETIIPGQQLIGMDMSTLPAGIYFLKVQHKKGVISRKIIKR